MLNIIEARKIYNDNPNDPYVVLPDHNIEVRFSEDGMITAAYNADVVPATRWGSQEFVEMLSKSRGGYGIVVQGKEASQPPQAQLEGAGKKARVRVRAADVFGQPNNR